MNDIDPITGLPKELSVWESITKESQVITVSVVQKKFRKKYTVIEGLDSKEINIKDIGKKLKNDFACGGTVKDGKIELQGDHSLRIKEALVKYGFAPNTIQVKSWKKN